MSLKSILQVTLEATFGACVHEHRSWSPLLRHWGPFGGPICRSEGFPNGIFHPCPLWARALARWKNCRRVVVAVGVIWKFRSTFRPGNYIWSFSYGFRVVVRDNWEWRPGFYSEFRYKSREHSGLAWGAILEKVLVLISFPRLPCSFFQEHVPKMDSFPKCPQTARSF